MILRGAEPCIQGPFHGNLRSDRIYAAIYYNVMKNKSEIDNYYKLGYEFK